MGDGPPGGAGHGDKERNVRAIKWLAAFAAVTPLLSHGAVAAQTAFGLKGGVTWADAAFIDQFTSEALLRKTGGGFVILPLSERATVGLEALYIERGFSTSGLHQDGSRTRMSYLDFPILLRFRLTPAPARVRPILVAGGYWGHEVGCRLDGGVAQFEESNSCEGRFRRRGVADVGLIVGALVEVATAGAWFATFEARYHYGVRNLYWDPASDGAKARNLAILAGVGVRVGG
ncbi:MAG: PorT family protein [Gemmatimonadales bacterium]|nr:PorT family protein [Gemmatimonadales bacterium]